MVMGVVPSAVSAASVTTVPPTLMLAMPASAATVKLPAVAAAVSGTLLSLALRPPSVSGTVTVGVPSVWPLIVMVSVALVLEPSPSVSV